MVSVYLFIPFYIRVLGIDAYGLVAFHSTILAFMFLCDAGLTAAFLRETSRVSDRSQLLDLLATLERSIATLGLAFGVGVLFAADYISSRWLNMPAGYDMAQASNTVALMGLSLVPQALFSMYSAGLIGLERHFTANLLGVMFVTFRSGMVLIPISINPSPVVFILWQLSVSMLFAILSRVMLLRLLGQGDRGRGKFGFGVLASIAPYSIGMFAMAAIAALNQQMDRLLVSRFESISTFAYYTVASSLAQIPALVVSPIGVALLPALIRLVEAGRSDDVRVVYEGFTYIASVLGALAASLLIIHPEAVMGIFFGQQPVNAEAATLVRILAVGGLFLAMQVAAFQLSLSNGHNKTNVAVGLVVLCISLPSQVVLIRLYGVIGAAIPWAVINVVAYVVLGFVLNRRFYTGSVSRWFWWFGVRPVLLVFASALIVSQLLSGIAYGLWPVGKLLAISAVALFVAVYFRPPETFNVSSLRGAGGL